MPQSSEFKYKVCSPESGSHSLFSLFAVNWKSGLTVALISVPLSIALAIASGAGPAAGLITGIWATLIASLFGGSHYNVVGAAGALATVLFSATITAPMSLGAAILPILAMFTGLLILIAWVLKADRFLYYVPSSVMYGFSGGVAFLIAASELFDATGLSFMKRTGTFLGDLCLYAANFSQTDLVAVSVFFVFLGSILVWKKYVRSIPAVIPASVFGVVFGFVETQYVGSIDLISLGDKFGNLTGGIYGAVSWNSIQLLLSSSENIQYLFKASSVIALIAILETLITAKIAGSLTRTEFSSRKELLGLAFANLGSGAMGGLPATGVFIRTGANIKAGATHRTSSALSALATVVISALALQSFTYIPMAVIAAILFNTGIGLIEVEKFKEFWSKDRSGFAIAILAMCITIFHDAALAVVVSSLLSLFLLTDRVSRGQCSATVEFVNGTKSPLLISDSGVSLPGNSKVSSITYGIGGFLSYIDSLHHARNLKMLARLDNVPVILIRLSDLFGLDLEGTEMLKDVVREIRESGKEVFIYSASESVRHSLMEIPQISST